MNKIQSIVITGMLFALFGYYGCDSMEDNFKEYLKEYNYSGKIDSLRVYPGLERVVLAWNNPKDQKSKSIKIIYGPDSTEVKYDSMVDSVSIEGLSGGTGYEFIVYTLDAHNNLSVPASITAFPVSQSFVETLTPPTLVVQTIGADQYISLVGTSNVVMSFSGNMEYSVTGPGGFAKTDKVFLPDLKGKSQVDIPVTSVVPLPFLPVGEYTFDYKVSVLPIIGNLRTIDEVWLSNKTTLNVEPVVINLMNTPGTVSDRFNTGGGEGIEKVIDNNPNTKYLCGSQQTWMLWKMERAFIASKYTMTSANDAPSRDPKDWVLEGSNDGTSWTQLDKQTDYTFPNRFQKVTFNLPNRTAYTHYRLNVTANHGSNLFQLADWILYYDSGQE